MGHLLSDSLLCMAGKVHQYTQEMETASFPIQDLKLIALIDMIM